jgi:hypothetical protein
VLDALTAACDTDDASAIASIYQRDDLRVPERLIR